MFDVNQIAIVAAITVTTVVFTVVGIQLILILKDIRSIVKKLHNISDRLESFGVSVGTGYSEIAGFLVALKKIAGVVDLLQEKNAKRSK